MRSLPVVFMLLLGCDLAPPSADASALDVSTYDAGLVADAPEVSDSSHGPDGSSESPDARSETPDAFVAADVAPTRCDVDAGGEAPTFRVLYADILEPYRCAECHRPAGRLMTELDLSSAEVAYASLVGVLGCDDVTPRVTPCDPTSSMLALIPTGRAESCGGRHTFGGVNPTGIVTPEERDRIDAWIAAGAAY
ncbi:MAG: hypothetical protein J0L92_39985 [Deltaproteobacteria bacterium]|nr:hypothetical protein [Deltaproteobacteria bacterium]